ncbi:MAG TPA: phosphate ABC transporter permease subunit PstC [Azospirillaceae bacterium]|nr:phosphate ABC transporter permease subunit PstC [Azospirillaceae bacterium]
MPLSILLATLLVLAGIGYAMGKGRASALAGAGQPASAPVRLHSQPTYHGWYVAIWCGLPALLLLAAWIVVQGPVVQALVESGLPPELRSLPPDRLALLMVEVRNLASGLVPAGPNTDPALVDAAERLNDLNRIGNAAAWVLVLGVAIAGLAYARRRLLPQLRARHFVERVANGALAASSLIAILTTVGIVLSLLFEAMRFFTMVSPLEFLFGTTWSPQTAIRADQAGGSSGAFGAVPLFTGTMLIAAIAMVVAVPIGLMSAIYLSEYAPRPVRAWVKPILEVLAGIPTVVYGFFAALTVAPLIRELGGMVGLEVASQSALAAGLVMGIMIVPFVSSLSDDVINAVPQSLRDGSYGLGATRAETIRQVVLPAALPGIGASFILAFSRALGETMIVAMAAGLAANLTANPLAAVTTVTVQIATLLVGDQEFDSPKTLSVFALGLMLFLVTLTLNVIALRIVQKYREKYD